MLAFLPTFPSVECVSQPINRHECRIMCRVSGAGRARDRWHDVRLGAAGRGPSALHHDVGLVEACGDELVDSSVPTGVHNEALRVQTVGLSDHSHEPSEEEPGELSTLPLDKRVARL